MGSGVLNVTMNLNPWAMKYSIMLQLTCSAGQQISLIGNPEDGSKC